MRDEYYRDESASIVVMHFDAAVRQGAVHEQPGYAVTITLDGVLRYIGPVYPTRAAALLDADTHLELMR